MCAENLHRAVFHIHDLNPFALENIFKKDDNFSLQKFMGRVEGITVIHDLYFYIDENRTFPNLGFFLSLHGYIGH